MSDKPAADSSKGHTHSHVVPSHGPAFAIGIGLNLAFVVVEAVYGLSAHSMALVADAGHNLSDVLGLAVAWGAARMALRPPSPTRTYGLRRVTILAALGNAVFLLIAIGAIAWEAIGRFRTPETVAGRTVMIVAAIGIMINGATALLFMRGRKDDLNIRGAFLHMAADAGVSLGVVLSGILIVATGWTIVDPIISLGIVLVVAWSTWGLLRDSVNLSLDGVPSGVSVTGVDEYLRGLPGVTDIHDLHIWGLSTSHAALTVHLIKPGPSDDDAFLAEVAERLHTTFGIEHVTVQIERRTGTDCRLAAPGAL